MSDLLAAAESFRAALSAFDPALLPGADCAAVVAELARTEKACSGARARAAARAADAGAYRPLGFPDAASWLAQQSGSSAGAAKAAIDTAHRLSDCPATAEALAAGELSLDQATEITRTEAAARGSESAMLAVARTRTLAVLREEGRKRRLGTIPPEDLERRQRAARRFRHWRDELGMVCGAFALPPLQGVAFVNRLDAETDRVWRAAGDELRAEPRPALMADAFLRMLEGKGRSRSRSAELVLVCDVNAFRRGHAHDGEPVHIVGGGPVSVATARAVFDDAFVKGVVHDGVDLIHLAHFGRYRKAELQTALDLGPPPAFSGATCRCGRKYGLEWDHVDPVANGGRTELRNFEPRCKPEHREKTDRDRQAGLLGPRAQAQRRGPPQRPRR